MVQVVVVFLRGGADGLSLLAPIGDLGYPSARGEIALDPATALPVDELFGLHPALRSLADRNASGGVAFVPAVGIPELSRSHFDAQFRVEQAGPAAGTGDGAGWLGRHLALSGGGDEPMGNPFRGVCFGQVGLPQILAGSSEVIAATSVSELRLGVGGNTAPTDLLDSMRQMWAGSESAWSADATAGFDAIDTAASLVSSGGIAGDDGAGGSPDHGVLDTVAAATAGIGVEVAVVNIGGWDTHDNQGTQEGAFAQLAGELDVAMAQLRSGLPDATIVVSSEFGRRIAANSSGGSDHGRGGLAIVEGPGVSGGVKGDWPTLADTDDGDVRVVNDVRVLMAEVTEAVLGSDPERTVPDAPDGSLALFA